MLARNVHKMIKQGRKWRLENSPKLTVYSLEIASQITESLIEISLPSNFRLFYIKQAPNHSKPSTKICEMC